MVVLAKAAVGVVAVVDFFGITVIGVIFGRRIRVVSLRLRPPYRIAWLATDAPHNRLAKARRRPFCYCRHRGGQR